jgi:hypothetical protein
LTINYDKPGVVVLLGVPMGAIGEKIEVDCGAKFVRLAEPGAVRGKVPTWLAEGRSIQIPCRKHTTLTFVPPAPSAPAGNGTGGDVY